MTLERNLVCIFIRLFGKFAVIRLREYPRFTSCRSKPTGFILDTMEFGETSQVGELLGSEPNIFVGAFA